MKNQKNNIEIPENINKDFIEKYIINKKDLILFGVKSASKIKVPDTHFAKSRNEYLFDLLFDIENPPVCYSNSCDNLTKFKTFKLGYSKFCSRKCAQNNIKVRNKLKKTILKKYGVNNISQSETIKEKKKKTFYKKNGYNFPNQKNIKNYKRYNKDFIEKYLIKDGIIDINWCMKYFNVNRANFNKFIKKKNIKFERRKYNKSIIQLNIFKFFKNNFKKYIFDINLDNRNLIKKEIDILINNKIAIEYNGLIFHSFGKSKISLLNNLKKEIFDKKKHLTKTELCEEQNIQLFHINENEWLDSIKQNIWKDIIKKSLNIYEKEINSIDCKVKELEYTEIKEFQKNNSLTEIKKTDINLGLFYNNELISVMLFKEFKNKYQLISYSSKLGLNIVDGYDKLLKAFLSKKRDNKELICQVDRRYFSINNKFLNKYFKLIEKVKPDYRYFHENNINKLYSKHYFTKDFAYKNGYRRIYNSGYLKYKLI